MDPASYVLGGRDGGGGERGHRAETTSLVVERLYTIQLCSLYSILRHTITLWPRRPCSTSRSTDIDIIMASIGTAIMHPYVRHSA